MLDHLLVEGFKSIRKLDLKLGPLNVMIGANGAGKSNLISLFQLINRIIDRKVQVYVPQSGGPDSLLHFGKKHTNRIYLKLDFGRNGYELSLIPTRENILVFTDEKCWFQDSDAGTPRFVDLGAGHKESNLAVEAQKIPDPIAGHVLQKMTGWKIYHFHDTGDSAGMKGPGNINDNARLNPDASNLASFLYFLRETHYRHYRNIVDTVRLAAPFLEDFILRPNPLNKELIQLEWCEKESDAYFNAHSLSDGTLRFICLAVLLMQPDLPSAILLDEPELGLHPYAISLLAGLLQSAAARTQVIFATQSVTLVNQFNPEDIIVVDREDKQSVFRHLDKKVIENWMEEYSIGELWEKNILGGRPAHE
jgi:predicted ATPase